MGNIWNIIGKKNRRGEEKEFKSFEDLDLERIKRAREAILKETNAKIRIRNEVRKRKNELEEKAMEFFENPAGIVEVANKVCDYFEKTYKMNWEGRVELENTVMETIIIPLEQDEKIEHTKIIRKVCSEWGGIFYVPLLQNKNLIKPLENIEIIDKSQ